VLRRAQAVLLILTLAGAPLSAAVQCCTAADCCQDGICPLPSQRKTNAGPHKASAPRHASHNDTEDSQPTCHKTERETAHCAMNATCGHSDASKVAPQPPAILTAVTRILFASLIEGSPHQYSNSLQDGVSRPPFHPPRP